MLEIGSAVTIGVANFLLSCAYMTNHLVLASNSVHEIRGIPLCVECAACDMPQNFRYDTVRPLTRIERSLSMESNTNIPAQGRFWTWITMLCSMQFLVRRTDNQVMGHVLGPCQAIGVSEPKLVASRL